MNLLLVTLPLQKRKESSFLFLPIITGILLIIKTIGDPFTTQGPSSTVILRKREHFFAGPLAKLKKKKIECFSYADTVLTHKLINIRNV